VRENSPGWRGDDAERSESRLGGDHRARPYPARRPVRTKKDGHAMVVKSLLLLLTLMLIGSLPVWPYSRRWDYYGAGGIGVLLLIVLILLRQNVF
jgi:hypothetical protein